MNIYGLTSLDTQALIEILSNSEDYLIKTYDRVALNHKLGYLYQVKFKNGFGISIAKVTYPLFSDEGNIESFDSLYSTLGFKEDLWSVAVMQDGKATDEVHDYCDTEKVVELAKQIQALPAEELS